MRQRYRRRRPPAASLNVGVAAELKVLDPHITTLAAYATTLRFTIFETLVEADDAGNYIPSLAESWEFADDGMSLTLNLVAGRDVPQRQGVHLRGRRLHHQPHQGSGAVVPVRAAGAERHRRRDAGRVHGRAPVLRANAGDPRLSAQRPDRHRAGHRPHRRASDRHRPLRVRGVGAQRPHHRQEVRRLPAARAALSG